MFCKECGLQHPAFSNYCTADGQAILPSGNSVISRKATGFCGGCGNEITSTGQYCQHCGISHSIIESAAIIPVPPAPSHPKTEAVSGGVSRFFADTSYPAVLAAAGLTILLVLLASFLLKDQVEQAIVKESAGAISTAEIRHLDNLLSEEMAAETGMDIDFPDVYNLFTYVSLLHTVDFEFSGEVISSDDSELFQERMEVLIQNPSMSFFLVMVILLIAGGLILSRFIKRNGLPVFNSILLFSVTYGVFLTIASYVAGFHFSDGLDVYYSYIEVEVIGTFPLVESFAIGTLMAAGISGLTAILALQGRGTLAFLQRQPAIVQYIALASAVTLTGVTFFNLVFFGFFDQFYGTSDYFYGSPAEKLLIGPLGMWVWNLSHLIPLDFSALEWEDREFFSLQLFSSYYDLKGLDDLYSLSFIGELFFINGGIPILLKMSLVVPALLLATVGYLLFQTHRQKFVELLKFSLVYAAVMTVIQLFTGMKFTVNTSGDDLWGYGYEAMLFQVNSDVVNVFITSALFALVFVWLGGFLNGFLGGKLQELPNTGPGASTGWYRQNGKRAGD
ncbi:zinc ribbon domain-containing protein [Planococcus lenghuensis]|uniref:Uncharacterized protein n=1 Tax=Planococcus lenghuensis TaxID=2213202 RepID=A0A1Q2L298_9BACL|nr:zinc ribbon domain-containing protein [Planococcus lenghuensis]AQQ54167.1 hypothetical protein B0X71_14340 [Planococcus lenghuensis]